MLCKAQHIPFFLTLIIYLGSSKNVKESLPNQYLMVHNMKIVKGDKKVTHFLERKM
jgi:hypothetical protein